MKKFTFLFVKGNKLGEGMEPGVWSQLWESGTGFASSKDVIEIQSESCRWRDPITASFLCLEYCSLGRSWSSVPRKPEDIMHETKALLLMSRYAFFAQVCSKHML